MTLEQARLTYIAGCQAGPGEPAYDKHLRGLQAVLDAIEAEKSAPKE